MVTKISAAKFRAAVVGAFVTFSVLTGGVSDALAAKKSNRSESWTTLARRVGQSEEFRARAIRELKNRKNLSQELRRGLKTEDRPLALEVISALDLKSLVPEMIALVPKDQDGFLILGLNAMMDEKNRSKILDVYLGQLQPRSIPAVSAGALMALLEPLGRLGVRLPSGSVEVLEKHKTAEVRGSLLYYVRLMALRHHDYTHVDVVDRMTRANEYQLRNQAISIQRELEGETRSSRKLVSR